MNDYTEKRKRYAYSRIFARIRKLESGKLNLHDADLRGADLCSANLCGANLYRADLRGANLRDAELCGANLYRANLRDANLRDADLRGANLCGANLYRANLRGAELYRANLYRADLCGCVMNWRYHNLISERLRQAAGDDPLKRLAAGYVAISTDWCWDDLIRKAPDITLEDGTSLLNWALTEMATWVRDGDDAPNVIGRIAKEIAA